MSSQLAITPQTEKCFLNMISAMTSIKVGCLVGENSVGKRQTLNQLAHVIKSKTKNI
jgi:hypothetical protein